MRQLLYASAAAVLAATVFSSYSSGVSSQFDGTGSPFANTVCGNCHNGGPYATEATLQLRDLSGAPVTSYLPGETYRLHIGRRVATAAAAMGVQAVVLDGANEQAGAFGAAPDGTRVLERQGRSYLDHQRRLLDSVVVIDWTAPAAGTGPVDVYAVVNSVNANRGTSGDSADEVQLTIAEAAPPPSYAPRGLAALRGVDPVTGVADSLGLSVEVDGIVYGTDTEPDVSNFNLVTVDNAAGIAVLNYSTDLNYDATEGDRVRVRGTLRQIGGLTYVEAVELDVLDRGEALPDPEEVTALDEALEGRLVTLTDLALADSSLWQTNPASTYDLPFVTADGDTVIAQIAEGMPLFGGALPGDPRGVYSVTGVVRQWDPVAPHFEGHYLLPRSADDFASMLGTSTRRPGADPVEFTVTPLGGGRLSVRADGAIAALRVVDLAGRTVARSAGSGLAAAELTLPAGPGARTYVVHVALADGRRGAKLVAGG